MGLKYPYYADETNRYSHPYVEKEKPPAYRHQQSIKHQTEGRHILDEEIEKEKEANNQKFDTQESHLDCHDDLDSQVDCHLDTQFIRHIIPQHLQPHQHQFHSRFQGSQPSCSFCNTQLIAPSTSALQLISINRILVENLFCIECNSYIGFKIINFIPLKPTLIPFESNGELLQYQNNLIHIENELKIRKEEMEFMRLVEKYGTLVGRIFYCQPGKTAVPEQRTTILSQE